MSKCANCRKADALKTPWEDFKNFLIKHLFPQELIDEKANSFTQGFGDGYTMGRQHQRESESRTEQDLAKLLKDL